MNNADWLLQDSFIETYSKNTYTTFMSHHVGKKLTTASKLADCVDEQTLKKTISTFELKHKVQATWEFTQLCIIDDELVKHTEEISEIVNIEDSKNDASFNNLNEDELK